jgi:hypothetical protein
VAEEQHRTCACAVTAVRNGFDTTRSAACNILSGIESRRACVGCWELVAWRERG